MDCLNAMNYSFAYHLLCIKEGNGMKNQKHHTVGTFRKSNRTVVEKGKMETDTIHERSLFSDGLNYFVQNTC